MGFCHNLFRWGRWMGMGGGGISLILNVVLFAGVLVLLGLAAVWLARQFRHATPIGTTSPDPLEIARRRLVAGEISGPEFEEIRNRLRD
ncbi:MAG: SHOCT domain-containing protein [Anaerolineae bacterium]